MKEKRAKGLPMYPGARKTYTILSLFIIGEAITIIAQAFYLARAITFLFHGQSLSNVLLDIVLFFAVFVLRYLLIHAEQAVAEKYASNTAQDLRNEVIDQYFNGDIHLRQQLGTGHLVTLAIEGIDHLKKYVEIIGIRMIKTVIVPIFIVLFVAYFDVISAVILV